MFTKNISRIKFRKKNLRPVTLSFIVFGHTELRILRIRFVQVYVVNEQKICQMLGFTSKCIVKKAVPCRTHAECNNTFFFETLTYHKVRTLFQKISHVPGKCYIQAEPLHDVLHTHHQCWSDKGRHKVLSFYKCQHLSWNLFLVSWSCKVYFVCCPLLTRCLHRLSKAKL